MSSRIDKFYTAYFWFHVAITLLVDAAIALPVKYQFDIQKAMLSTHIAMNNDVLVAAKPAWLQGFVWIELVLQVPFFIWAGIALPKNDIRVYPAILAYGVEASTTTFACLVEILSNPDISAADQRGLMGLYLPTFIIPLLMAVDFGLRISKKLKAQQSKTVKFE
ncbi:Ema19 protein [Starmerella bacillaris]|uniref:Efficient mitochondria targeting-associated protein 19 n=1 Tax=Starmerella bacillaris TaxID=1247836 RepID=A0AAV5RE32_STABA|nr:Ema19 protein [Starmerella bacillaris]